MVLFTGKTVEEAIESGLKQMGISRMKAHIRVISREKKGFLGFGRKLARVEIEGINEKTAHKADQKAVRGVPDSINKQNAPVSSSVEDTVALNQLSKTIKELEKEELDKETKEQALEHKISAQEMLEHNALTTRPSAATVSSETFNQKEKQTFEDFVADAFDEVDNGVDIAVASKEVSQYVQKIIYEMDLETSIETTHNHRQINLQIETPEAGRVIGYHGKVLKSLQLLAQNFLHDHYSKHFSVSLNVHDYMEHRTKTLIDFAHKIAKRVLDSGKAYQMDPMSNSERKVVHKTITGIEGVESYSEGNDPNRYVVIASKSN
ncbi:RNA-binding cell elongation regulator Jag/EloR [Streptococcus troglodytae]|uniref:RNA-binding protein KhpB n=1 Tax=Streptococcus troglodytae TaxID=1111760 RepID=A0A1L7LLP1_9STRE|nr:RNA-binding cell elongation regulator Jag/EloR [Streptococcus troglodytae]BAQ25030.1 Jag protein [Streptococcus troglodytae]